MSTPFAKQQEELEKWLMEAEDRCDRATEDPKLTRYDHGGGRAMVIDGRVRIVVADYYDEGNREFYHNARTDLPRALKIIRAVLEWQGYLARMDPDDFGDWNEDDASAMAIAIFKGRGPSESK